MCLALLPVFANAIGCHLRPVERGEFDATQPTLYEVASVMTVPDGEPERRALGAIVCVGNVSDCLSDASCACHRRFASGSTIFRVQIMSQRLDRLIIGSDS